ncbi:hypothetical protein [Massilia sp. DD77]|uniref:hypothetical protein n=1 Tax=Massilia sp. DD77 TaxID=3109349 RepID=UPI002FFEBCF9
MLDVENVAWAVYAVWAPPATEHNGKFYLFFGANDIKTGRERGGIGPRSAPFREIVHALLPHR